MSSLLPWFLGLGLALAGEPGGRRSTVPEKGSLHCATVEDDEDDEDDDHEASPGDPCALVLPGAVRFERPSGKPYVAGYDRSGDLVGWVVLSNDVTDIKGYSGKPLSTLVGLDTEGVISGGRVIHHAEPILLVGIPEQKLHDFVSAYTGVHAEQPVVVGRATEGDDAKSVDIVSGATVTVLAQNQTILAAARALGADVGVIARPEVRPGRFVPDAPWSWRRMQDEGALGHLRLTAEQMGAPPAERPFLDAWFGLIDAPQLGIPLIGEFRWKKAMDALAPGEHLFVVFNAGSGSFKGSGFVRGGIFDRFRLEQGLSVQTFRDMDYTNLDPPDLEGTPAIWEAGLFIVREGTIDPGRTYNFIFVGSLYDGKGGFSREFHSFTQPYREPPSVYVSDGPDPEAFDWAAAWQVAPARTVAVGLWLLFVIGLFVGRRYTAGKMSRLKRLHVGVMLVSSLGLGFALQVQPSVTQLLTLIGSAAGEWRWSLFLSDPVVFLSWIFIAIVTVAWGRGVFCGWVCPFGTMNELLFKLGHALGLRERKLPDLLHQRAKYLRYVVLVSLVVTYLVDAETGERMAEVEPFKSTFFVPVWTRHPLIIAWWALLVGSSLVVWRPFCQYVCPLGAGLALPSHFRLSGPYRRDFCSKCKICTRGCEPRAIGPTGVIDGKDCLNCMECEVNWQDDQVCPPLVKERRDRDRGKVA